MKLKSLESLQLEAVITPAPETSKPRLSKREKLRLWIVALEARGDARLPTLWGVEYAPKKERMMQRQDDSPIAVAFADPTLRAAGLKDDTYGAALEFFEIGEERMHKLTCRCQFGSYVPAQRVANRMRGLMNNPIDRMVDGVRGMMASMRARTA